ncbi:MAG: isoaspartyl peptidase/L-asparaginase [Pseudomonadota bacterium]
MSPIALAIHGGAGRLAKSKTQYPKRVTYEQALLRALKAGHLLLLQGGCAESAVVAAVSVLENEALFNAGHGAAICADGSIEMCASIMNGHDLSVGAMVGLKRAKNPIQAAQTLLPFADKGFLFGTHGDAFAENQGVTIEQEKYFKLPLRVQQWRRMKKRNQVVLDHSDDDTTKGTVGAVAIDQNGNLSAGTSTGGLVNQIPGRIGDSPIIGAGNWADNNTCAISATGTGEAFSRVVFSKRVADLMELQQMSARDAALKTLADVKNLKGEGGCIIIDNFGQVTLEFNTSQMLRGWVIGHEKPKVAILPGEQVEVS